MSEEQTLSAVQAGFSAPLPESAGADGVIDFQWAPPGTHTATPYVNGEPKEITVTVDAGVAARCQAWLVSALAKAKAGKDDLPYTDFNHEDREASAHPIEFSWGGDDPITGGVRCKARLTAPGEAALKGRAYRRFSPGLWLSRDHKIIEPQLNAGGFVNNAAFKAIASVWSKKTLSGAATEPNNPGGSPPSTTTEPKGKNDMPDNNDALVQAKADLTTANNQVTELKATNTALQTQVTELTTKIEGMQTQLATQAKANAEAVVKTAVANGQLPPQNEALHTQWKNTIEKDPGAAELLSQMPADFKEGATVVNNAGGGGNGAKGGEHAFIVNARGLAKTASITETEAQAQLAQAKPELYEQYLNQNRAQS